MAQRVLIVIPAHNEEHSIAGVINGLRQVAPDYDRVVVNDGSEDATEQVLGQLGEKQLRLIHNLGYGQALQTGIKYGLQRGYDIIVTMDADGQHRAQDVPRLVGALDDCHVDVVIGSRFMANRSYKTPFSRRLGQLIFSRISQALLGQRIFDTSSGFKAMRATACDLIVNGTMMDFHIEMLVRLSRSQQKIIELPIVVEERKYGRSMHSFSSVFQYPVKTILLTIVAIMEALIERRTR